MLALVEAVLARAGTAASGEAFLDEMLDQLVEVCGADRGLIVVENGDGACWLVHARAPGKALAAAECEALLEEVLGAPAPRQWARADAGVVALIAPLRGAEGRAAIYVDHRGAGDAAQLPLVALVAQIVSLVLERTQRLEQARARLRRGPAGALPGPSLDELLAFESLAHVREELAHARVSREPIVITSVTGAGKTALALALAHATSTGPVVHAALATLDPAALFGQGARHRGLVEDAAGGTLILDDVDALDATVQRGLLDLRQADARVRLIATATSRSDFVDALGGHRIELLPLSHRRAELPALAAAIARRFDHGGWCLGAAALARLCDERVNWPGNMRQLEQVLARARLQALIRDPDTREIEAADLDVDAAPVDDLGGVWTRLQAQHADLVAREAAVIAAALAKHAGNESRAAAELGISRAELSRRR